MSEQDNNHSEGEGRSRRESRSGSDGRRSSGSSGSSRSTRSSSKSGDKRKRKKRRRRHSDPLDEKVRQLRKLREQRTIQRQRIERQVFVVAGVGALLLALIISISLMADWDCPYCISIIMTAAMLSLIAWSIFKFIEVVTIRRYRYHRNAQKERDTSEV